jgi:LPS sulfotransferase NodH
MKHHIILTSGRSGSNYLANTLNQHPKIVNYGEVLAGMILPYKLYSKCKKICRWSVIDYLNYIYNSKIFFYSAQFYSAYSHIRKNKPINFKKWGNVSQLGTKDFFLNYRNKNAFSFLFDHEEIAIIYLHRENRLRRYLSGVFLQQTRVVSSEKQLEISKVYIDTTQMMKYLEILDREIEDEKNIISQLKNHRLLSLKYEDYFADENSILTHHQQIFEFLGVEPILAAKSQHKKILPQSMADLVENYDEFYACLKNSQYQQYLDD